MVLHGCRIGPKKQSYVKKADQECVPAFFTGHFAAVTNGWTIDCQQHERRKVAK